MAGADMKDVNRNDNSTRRAAGSGMAKDNNKDTDLNPRIAEGLSNLYDDIVNQPLPDKITGVLERLREEEQRQSKSDKVDSSPEPEGEDGKD